MVKNKHKIFLWIGFSVLLFSIIVLLVGVITSYKTIQNDFPNDKSRQSLESTAMFGYVVFFLLPIFAVELSWIRSTYKLLKYEYRGLVKICYYVSSSLSFFAFVLQWLIVMGCINFNNIENGQSITMTLFLVTEWPVVILSSILGSVRCKAKQVGVAEQNT